MNMTKGGCNTKDNAKVVRFHTSPSYVTSQQSNDENEPPSSPSSSLWYTRDEYKFLRTKSKLLGLEIRRSNAGKLNCVNVAYHIAGQLASSLSSSPSPSSQKSDAEEEEEEMEVAMSSVPHDKTLLPWCSYSTNAGGHTRRGLERVGSKSHNAEREVDQKSAIRNVLAEQDRQRNQQKNASIKKLRLQQQQQREKQRRCQEEKCDLACPDDCSSSIEEDCNTKEAEDSSTDEINSNFSGGNVDISKKSDEDSNEMNERKLRMASMASTRRARLFARMLGEADAAEAIRISRLPNDNVVKKNALEELPSTSLSLSSSSSDTAALNKNLSTTTTTATSSKFENGEREVSETFSVATKSNGFSSNTSTVSLPSSSLSAPLISAVHCSLY